MCNGGWEDMARLWDKYVDVLFKKYIFLKTLSGINYKFTMLWH